MKSIFPALLTAAVAVAWTRPVPAQEPPAAGRAAQLLERLKAADADGDGMLSKDEVPEPLQDRFSEADTNGDGELDREELKRAVAAGLLKQAAPGLAMILQHVKAIDTDGDGNLSLDEVVEDARQRFAKLDANGDGKLEKQELKPVLDAVVEQLPGLAKVLPQELSETDANGDHLLTSDEVVEKQKKDFARADADGDGKIDAGELKRAVARFLKPSAGVPAEILKRFKAADANGDGKLSPEEAPDRIRERFDRIDANGDGLIDLEELREALARRAAASP